MRRLDLWACGGVMWALATAGCGPTIRYEGGGAGGTTATGGAGGAGGETTTTTTTSSTTTSSTTTTPGTCVTGSECTALDGPCVKGACVNGMCTALPANDGFACDDGQFCTANDACKNGTCVGGSNVACPSTGPCTAGACDEATKTCLQVPANNGAQCDDGDPCTYFGVCQGGACTKGQTVDCTFLNGTCTKGVCDPVQGCVSAPQNDGSPCEDGQFCTTNDTCSGGLCKGGPPKQCAPPGGCFIGTCDEATDSCTSVPGNNGAACDDGSPCTANTTCSNGVCGNGMAVNNGAACDDGSSCTVSTTCSAGVCTGGMGPTIYFADDFKDASKGWTLGPEWQIGPAAASPVFVGNPDPATDHTSTADNGVAGVEIGGNATTNIHPYYYLESPAFNTAGAPGTVVFGFYRWLNSDYDPFMHNTVEVYDGTKWVAVWESGQPPGIMDAAWTYQSFDVTAYKNVGMRVRFGFNIGNQGVFTIGSWNVDDVLVASAACP
ncbi:MAG: hypothetical protein U0441_31010 [Polyangiaceae bacterium]